MQKLCLIGYITYLGLSSIFYIMDIVTGGGGSGKILKMSGWPILILASIMILIGTTSYLFRILPKINIVILIILSILATFLQVVILAVALFFFVMYVLALILGRCGYYVTMP